MPRKAKEEINEVKEEAVKNLNERLEIKVTG